MADTPWRTYSKSLAEFIQAMRGDKARVVSVTDVTGTSQTFSSLESLMKAYKYADSMAQQEEAETVKAGSAWGCIKLTRNGS